MSEQRDSLDPHAAQEWSDQERAWREERLGVPSTHAEPRVAQYRLLARIMREPVEDSLPGNFAALVAERAEAASEMSRYTVEGWIYRAFLSALALIAVVFFAGDAVVLLQHVFGSGGGGVGEAQATVGRWVFAIAVCIAVSFVFEPWNLAHPRRPRLTR
jgi:hypothetical protein